MALKWIEGFSFNYPESLKTMQTVILRYDPPSAAQPAIDFRFGPRLVHLEKGKEAKVAADPSDLPSLPPGVTAEVVGAKPARPSRVLAAKRGEKFVPARRAASPKDDTKTAKKTEEKK